MESVRISQATGRRLIVGLIALAGATLLMLACQKDTTGFIQVNSTPTGAAISLDGVSTGYTTNYTLANISAGTHTITLTQSGYDDFVQGVSVVAGQTATVTATLTPSGGSGYTHTDDFATNTTANYQSYSFPYGGGSATATIGYDPTSQKATLTGVGGYADLVMKPKDAPAIQPGKDFSFGYDVVVLDEFTGMIYLGDLQGFTNGTWLRFGLDTYGGAVLVYVIVNGTERDIHSEFTSATSGTLKVARTGSTYAFYLNGSQFWSGAIPELDGLTLNVGANARISSGSSGVTAEISVDNWNQVQQ
ncbi:MAG: PEGA domain-containing protein [candidate division WOR-3 bacterium]|nr:PEGA domain-containing protein [candidate division WOR-3 bacterium]